MPVRVRKKEAAARIGVKSCRYFLTGMCAKGDDCVFSHGTGIALASEKYESGKTKSQVQKSSPVYDSQATPMPSTAQQSSPVYDSQAIPMPNQVQQSAPVYDSQAIPMPNTAQNISYVYDSQAIPMPNKADSYQNEKMAALQSCILQFGERIQNRPRDFTDWEFLEQKRSLQAVSTSWSRQTTADTLPTMPGVWSRQSTCDALPTMPSVWSRQSTCEALPWSRQTTADACDSLSAGARTFDDLPSMYETHKRTTFDDLPSMYETHKRTTFDDLPVFVESDSEDMPGTPPMDFPGTPPMFEEQEYQGQIIVLGMDALDRDAQPVAGINAALGSAFNIPGKPNVAEAFPSSWSRQTTAETQAATWSRQNTAEALTTTWSRQNTAETSTSWSRQGTFDTLPTWSRQNTAEALTTTWSRQSTAETSTGWSRQGTLDTLPTWSRQTTVDVLAGQMRTFDDLEVFVESDSEDLPPSPPMVAEQNHQAQMPALGMDAPDRDAQPVAGIDAALGSAFNSAGHPDWQARPRVQSEAPYEDVATSLARKLLDIVQCTDKEKEEKEPFWAQLIRDACQSSWEAEVFEEEPPPDSLGKQDNLRHPKAKGSHILNKTKMCKFFLKGNCMKGESCGFAHDVEDLRDSPDFYRTRPCIAFNTYGYCRHGTSCNYAHSADQLVRAKHSSVPTSVPSVGKTGAKPQKDGETKGDRGKNSSVPTSVPRVDKSGAKSQKDGEAKGEGRSSHDDFPSPSSLPKLEDKVMSTESFYGLQMDKPVVHTSTGFQCVVRNSFLHFGSQQTTCKKRSSSQ